MGAQVGEETRGCVGNLLQMSGVIGPLGAVKFRRACKDACIWRPPALFHHFILFSIGHQDDGVHGPSVQRSAEDEDIFFELPTASSLFLACAKATLQGCCRFQKSACGRITAGYCWSYLLKSADL